MPSSSTARDRAAAEAGAAARGRGFGPAGWLIATVATVIALAALYLVWTRADDVRPAGIVVVNERPGSSPQASPWREPARTDAAVPADTSVTAEHHANAAEPQRELPSLADGHPTYP